MPRLTDIFNNDSDSSSSSNDSNVMGDLTGDITAAIGLDANNNTESWSRDEDGNESYDSRDSGLNLDTSTDGLLDAAGNAMGSSDESTND